MPKVIKKYGKITLILGLILILVVMYLTIPIGRAAVIANRSITLSDTRPEQTGVTYDFQGDHSTTSVQCLEIKFCTTATGGCTFPSTEGMSVDSAAATSTGWNKWTYATWSSGFATTSEGFKYTSGGEAGTSSASFSATNITNATSGTYYARVYSFTDAGCSTPSGGQDSGVVAFAILSGVSVTATVAETLSFAIDNYSVSFGELSTSVRWATSGSGSGSEASAATLTLATNAAGGATITIEDIGDESGNAAGLYKSAAPAFLIPAAASTEVTASSGKYGAYGRNASSTLPIDEGFDDDTTGDLAIARSPQNFAMATSSVSNATVELALKAAASGATPAGSYADTVIFIAIPIY